MNIRMILGWFIAIVWTILFFSIGMGNAKPGSRLSVNFVTTLLCYLVIGAAFIFPFWLLMGG